MGFYKMKYDNVDFCFSNYRKYLSDIDFQSLFGSYMIARSLYKCDSLSLNQLKKYTDMLVNMAHKLFGLDFQVIEMLFEKNYFNIRGYEGLDTIDFLNGEVIKKC